MADTILKRWNGSAWEEVYPKTSHTQIVASGTPSSSTFLRGDGTWATPAGVDNYVNTTGDTMTGNLTVSNANVLVTGTGLIGIGNTSPSEKLDVTGNIILSGDNRYLTFGKAGNGSSIGGRWMSIEGNTDASGEGSSRIFFSEHNATTGSMDAFGMSLGYRGGDAAIVSSSGNTWTGLGQIGNGEWGMWGHNGNNTGALIMSGDRAATYVRFQGRVELTNNAYIEYNSVNDSIDFFFN